MKTANLFPQGLLRHRINSTKPEYLSPITESMKTKGWVGRRILVEEVDFWGHPQFYPWTGSHRLQAAVVAGLAEIPCLIIEAAEAEAGFGDSYDKHGYGSYREAIAGHLGPGDAHKLLALQRAGLIDAANLMQEEIDENAKPSIRYGDSKT